MVFMANTLQNKSRTFGVGEIFLQYSCATKAGLMRVSCFSVIGTPS